MAGRKKALDPAARFSATIPLQKAVILNWSAGIEDKEAFRESIRHQLCRRFLAKDAMTLLHFNAGLLQAMQMIGDTSLAETLCGMSLVVDDRVENGVVPLSHAGEFGRGFNIHSVWNSSMLDIVNRLPQLDSETQAEYIATVKTGLALLCLPFYSDYPSIISSSCSNVDHPNRYATTAALSMFCSLSELGFNGD